MSQTEGSQPEANLDITNNGEEPEAFNWQTDESVDHKSQLKRLDEIHKARERVIEKKHETEAGVATGSITNYEARTILRSAVEDYILEVAPIIKGHEEHKDFWTGDEDEPLGTFVLPNGEEIEIVGLEDVVDADNPYITTSESVPQPPPGWAEWPAHRLEEVKRYTKSETQIPRDILVKARAQVDHFLYEVGLDIRLKEDLHKTEITQKLLKQVQKFRAMQDKEWRERGEADK